MFRASNIQTGYSEQNVLRKQAVLGLVLGIEAALLTDVFYVFSSNSLTK
jgi:hypothetical protein